MGLGYRRLDFQEYAVQNLEDARLLLAHGRYKNAYYLSGYAVELGLKACIAKTILAETVPDKAILNGFLVHDFTKLLGLAGLTFENRALQTRDPDFAANWATVCGWSIEKRYDSVDNFSAQYMLHAIQEPTTGVISWIQRYW